MLAFKKCYLSLPEEELKGAEALENLVSKIISTGSTAGKSADRSETFLCIGVPEADIKNVRVQTGSRFYYELGTVTLQISAR